MPLADRPRIRLATVTDLPAVLATDHMRADPERRDFVRKAIELHQCWLAEAAGEAIGYVVADESFFGYPFIELLMVAPTFRRGGVGTALMRHVEALFSGPKLFTSTNQSNLAMQALLDRLGYVRSGVIDNLDEDDPELVYFKRN
jgi:ribosomal protein S18 acetylase RimI-like enzyme